jgi:hypothetical protein
MMNLNMQYRVFNTNTAVEEFPKQPGRLQVVMLGHVGWREVLGGIEFTLPAGQADFILSTDGTDGRRFQVYGIWSLWY